MEAALVYYFGTLLWRRYSFSWFILRLRCPCSCRLGVLTYSHQHVVAFLQNCCLRNIHQLEYEISLHPPHQRCTSFWSRISLSGRSIAQSSELTMRKSFFTVLSSERTKKPELVSLKGLSWPLNTSMKLSYCRWYCGRVQWEKDLQWLC